MADPDSLQQLQQRFQSYLTDDDEDFVDDIVSTDNALAKHRLGAYYNAYRLRLIEALATDFKVLQRHLGEETFEYLVLDYLRAHPSRHPSLRWFGQHLADFIANSGHNDAHMLSELARFEWTQGLCFDAVESPHFSLEDMSMIAPEQWPQMTFEFQPSVQWLDLYWNIPPLWQAINMDEQPPVAEQTEFPTRWILWRKDLSPHWRSLDVSEAWALDQAKQGASFAEICEGLLEWHGEDSVAMAAAGFLRQWIHDDMLSTIHPIDSP